MKTIYFFFVLLAFVVASCKKEKPEQSQPTTQYAQCVAKIIYIEKGCTPDIEVYQGREDVAKLYEIASGIKLDSNVFRLLAFCIDDTLHSILYTSFDTTFNMVKLTLRMPNIEMREVSCVAPRHANSYTADIYVTKVEKIKE